MTALLVLPCGFSWNGTGRQLSSNFLIKLELQRQHYLYHHGFKLEYLWQFFLLFLDKAGIIYRLEAGTKLAQNFREIEK